MSKPNNTVSLKRILILLLSAMILIAIFVIQRGPKKTVEVTPNPEATPSLPTSVITAEPFITAPYKDQTYAPLQVVDNTTGFVSGWTPSVTDGAVTGTITYTDAILDVSYAGANLEACSYYRDGLPFQKGSKYSITFNASASYARSITMSVLNADTQAMIVSQTYSIGETAQPYTLEFTNGGESTYNGRIVFYIGNDGSEQAKGSYTVTLSTIRLVNSSDTEQNVVRVNQIGYTTDSQKRCTFSYDEGDAFDVINAETEEVVYTGAVLNRTENPDTGEVNYYGEFTNLTTPGTYYIRTQIGDISYPFEIQDNPYQFLTEDALKMISLQRCGMELNSTWADGLSHPICHSDLATIYGTTTTIDVTGGWHDAGDYGRYVKTGSKSVVDLLLAYMYNPQAATDSTGSADSSNGISDALDEARYELEWMLKMQAEDGGVYNKVLTTNIPGTVLPNQDIQPLWVLPEQTTTTGDFVGSMALASMAYSKVDAEFAATCLQAAEKAYTWLKNNPDIIDTENPAEVTGGVYIDSDDSDERYFAASMLYVATEDVSYLEDAKSFFDTNPEVAVGTGWKSVGAYSSYLVLTISKIQEDNIEFAEALRTAFIGKAETLLGTVNGNDYNLSIVSYAWGSNGDVADNGIYLTMTYDFTGDQRYRQAAVEQLNYILGKNSMSLCFVSQYGDNSPNFPHSRVALAKNSVLAGALVGGPDSSREDPVTQALAEDIPNAKVYVDSADSYSTNEIAIYWNSALYHLLIKLQ